MGDTHASPYKLSFKNEDEVEKEFKIINEILTKHYKN